MTLRLLHVVPTYLPATRYGGPIYSVHGLCRALAARGHRVRVLTTNVDGAEDSDVPLEQPVLLDGVEVWYFRSQRLRRLYYAPAMRNAAQRLLRETDAVHLHSVFLWPTSMVARLAHAQAVPYVLAPRGMLVPELVRRRNRVMKNAWLRLIEQRTLREATRWHATSAAEVLDAQRTGLSLPPAVVIPNGVDMEPATLGAATPLPEPLRTLTAQPFVLFLGRVHWKKGLDRLLDALAGTELRLIVAGGDDEGLQVKLQRQAQRLGLGARVHFVGEVHGSAKAQLLASARLLALTSYNENFGNSVVEAMAVGCPVLVTPEVGAAQLVRDAGAGLVVSGDTATLRRGLLQLWHDDGARARMSAAGRSFVTATLGWAAIAERTERMYRQILY
jgi:glycosyltransferase involved in cell wall biosynthesis